MNDVLSILLVEDNPADVELMRHSLTESSIPTEIQIVNSGDHAISLLERSGTFTNSSKVDIIFMDINLPKKDGIHVLKEVRAHEDQQIACTPVVMMSVSQNPKEIRRSYQAGANVFVSKPASVGDFLDVLNRVRDFWLNTAVLPSRTLTL